MRSWGSRMKVILVPVNSPSRDNSNASTFVSAAPKLVKVDALFLSRASAKIQLYAHPHSNIESTKRDTPHWRSGDGKLCDGMGHGNSRRSRDFWVGQDRVKFVVDFP